jgi:hypothetical protein
MRAPSSRRTVIVVVIALLAALGLAVVGFRRHGGNAKTAEATHILKQIADAAVAAHGRDGRICPSASRAVPEVMRTDCTGALTGIYLSSAADWKVDEERKAGFSCLGFSLDAPQYYQYEYSATDHTFVARARSCMPELAALGSFEIQGYLRGGQMIVSDVINR